MMGTDLADEYVQVAAAFGYDLDTMERISLDGIEASFAPAEQKAALRERFEAEFVALRDELISVG